MQPSPLQLLDVRFVSISVVPREAPNFFAPHEDYEPFRFEDTRIKTSIGHALADENESEPYSAFMVALTVQIPDEGNNPPPYICNIECVGYFSISKKAFPDPTKRLDVGVVNGASMLYGVIREMISNITSRSWYGRLLLPSSSFQDHAPSAGMSKDTGTGDSSPPKRPKKSTAKPKSTRTKIVDD